MLSGREGVLLNMLDAFICHLCPDWAKAAMKPTVSWVSHHQLQTWVAAGAKLINVNHVYWIGLGIKLAVPYWLIEKLWGVGGDTFDSIAQFRQRISNFSILSGQMRLKCWNIGACSEWCHCGQLSICPQTMCNKMIWSDPRLCGDSQQHCPNWAKHFVFCYYSLLTPRLQFSSFVIWIKLPAALSLSVHLIILWTHG